MGLEGENRVLREQIAELEKHGVPMKSTMKKAPEDLEKCTGGEIRDLGSDGSKGKARGSLPETHAVPQCVNMFEPT